MFKHILVPLDGSHLAEAALPLASSLAHVFRSSVTLLHVIEQDAPMEIHRDHHLTNAKEALEYLSETAKRFFLKGIKVVWHVHTAPVADVSKSIVEHSTDNFKPDLIILTSHGNSGIHDLVFGTIAQQVAADSGTPVMLIKPTQPNSPFEWNHILVPLDNESIHDQALPFAEKIARAYRAELDLVCVIPTRGTLTGAQAAAGQMLPATAAAYLEIAEEIAHDHFQAHLDDFQKAGIQATALIARGDPTVEILKAAREQNSSLIIFGTHGRAGMDAFWNRSVTASVARRLDIPVLLIPLPS